MSCSSSSSGGGGVRAVLDFLLANGFHRAAAALRDDVAASSSSDPDHAVDQLLLLPPVRTEVPRSGGIDAFSSSSSSSSSSDVFLSMVSSPSDLTNPYFFYTGSSKSPDAHSEFATARDYKDSADWSWYDWKDPYLTQERFTDGSVGPVFDDRGEKKAVYDGDCAGDVPVDRGGDGWGDVSWGRLLNELSSGEEIKNVDMRLDLPKSDGNAGGRGGAANADFCLSHGKKESESLDHPTVETFADNNGLNGDFDLYSYARKLTQADETHSSEFVKNENDVETQDQTIAADNRGDDDASSGPQIQEYQEDEYEVFDLKIIHRKNRTGFEASKDAPVTLNSITAGRYRITGYLGSAAFSKVFQAQDLWTGVDVCLKVIRNNKDFFDQSLDEIKLLKYVNKNDPADEHHIIRLYDYFYHQEHLFIVCELLKANLYVVQSYNQESAEESYFTLPRIQSIAQQCLEALAYLHHLGVIHCDLKPENILINSYTRCEIKIIDLGSSCFLTDNLCLYVQSRSYRAPEVILGIPYDQKIDIWSLGCILAELFCGNVLFPNESIAMLLGIMIGILGPIDTEMLIMGQATDKYFTKDLDLYQKDEKTEDVKYIIPRMSSLARFLGNPDPHFLDFLLFLLQINPQKRPTAEEALKHPWLSYQYQ